MTKSLYISDLGESDQIFEDVIDYFTNVDTKSLNLVNRGIKSKDKFQSDVTEFLKSRHANDTMVQEIWQRYEKFLWGYYILDDLINDPAISDIKVLNENNIRIKKCGKRLDSHLKFKNKYDYKRFVDMIAVKNKTNLSDINAIQIFTDKESNQNFILRFNISTSFVNSSNSPYVHIRKIPKKKLLIEDLVQMGVMNQSIASYLVDAVIDKQGMVFCGKGASGKTTLMNALIECIPYDESGLVIQESEELFSRSHPDLMFQKVITSKGEGKIQYTLKDLAINGLLTDLDRFIIGEIKGGEALYFLNASYTGHKVMCSTHSNSSSQALDKIADFIKYESDYSREDALKMLSTLSTVVFMKDFKIDEISEIEGWDNSICNIKYKRIFKNQFHMEELE